MIRFFQVKLSGAFENHQAFAWLTPAQLWGEIDQKESVTVWVDANGQMLDLPFPLGKLEVIQEL